MSYNLRKKILAVSKLSRNMLKHVKQYSYILLKTVKLMINWGKEWSDFDPQRTLFYLLGSRLWSKVSTKLMITATTGEVTDRQADRQTDIRW